ncbi:MAG: immunity 26/phosphotriesterase HocA family protein, partial [Oscillospiraceae bacterium]|nr:immunity 26/phosphotriesterase HocA family protein [Oscillospiraceae bacterium]
MSEMSDKSNFWFCGWDEAPKHLQRYIYAGRIFCFEFDESTYCFGRIMTKSLVGYIAEIFDYTSPLPQITEDIIISAKRIDVLVLDTKNLFERNNKHSWRIIGDQRNYVPEDTNCINYRIGTELKKVDFFGNVTEISKEEAAALAPLVPLGDDEVKQNLALKLGKEYVPGKNSKKKPELEIWGWDKKPRTML